MRFAKLINGSPSFWVGHTTIGEKDIFTSDPRPYGYKPVVYPDPPVEEGMIAVFDGWEETETEIRQKWRLAPIPEPEPTIEDRVDNLEEAVDGIISGETA